MAAWAKRLVGLASIALALALAQPPAAQAKIVVSEKISYYPVSGRSGTDLGRAMLRGGAQRINLRHAIAATVTRFDFDNPRLAVEGGRCVVKDVTVRLTITYQLPQWSARQGASPALRRAWDVFYKELVAHERTHGRIARDFARIVEREMLRLSGTRALDCRDFGAFSDRRFSALASELKRRQNAFDERENRATSRISRLQTALLETR